MKKRIIFTFLAALLLAGCNTSGGENTNIEDLSEFFVTLQESDYNFTLYSKNESSRWRELRSLSTDAISFQSGRIYANKNYVLNRYGMFYVEGQGVQDYSLTENDEVIVEFYEGPGRVNIPATFAGDTQYFSDSYFSHLPVDELIGLDLSSFRQESKGKFYSKDKNINEKFCLLTNAYYLNWDAYTPLDLYIDFSKCITYVTLENNTLKAEVKMGFNDAAKKALGIDDDYDLRPEMSISNLGNTHHQSVEAYLAKPNQPVKKTSFVDDEEEFAKTFGNVALPTPNDDFGALVSTYADYQNTNMTIFDSSATSNSIKSFKAALDADGSSWYFNEAQTEESKSKYPYDSELYTYSCDVVVVEDGELVEFVDYLTFTFVPADMLEPIDRAIRPNGYFYAELYRLVDSEAIVGYENIKETFESLGLTETIPMFPDVIGFRYSLRDLTGIVPVDGISENSELAFLYEITITKFTLDEIKDFVSTWKNNILAIDNYQEDPDVTEQYQLSIAGSFEEDGGSLNISIAGNIDSLGESNQSYKIYLIGVYTID